MSINCLCSSQVICVICEKRNPAPAYKLIVNNFQNVRSCNKMKDSIIAF